MVTITWGLDFYYAALDSVDGKNKFIEIVKYCEVVTIIKKLHAFIVILHFLHCVNPHLFSFFSELLIVNSLLKALVGLILATNQKSLNSDMALLYFLCMAHQAVESANKMFE